MNGDENQIVASETSIIAEFFAPLTEGDSGAFELKDDCAVITPEPGFDFVVTTDSLIEGVHFFAGDVPSFKALAVNVSDLVAKGATPVCYLLNLALPEAPTRGFLKRLTAGLAQAQQTFGCHLIGGDTDRTSGLLTLTITAIGKLPKGSIVRRSGGSPGDIVAVTGTIGDAGLGLVLRKDEALADALRSMDVECGPLLESFDKPRPNVAVADLVGAFATAAMDVSDGLAKDAARMAATSNTGAELHIDAVPVSAAAQAGIDAGLFDKLDMLGSGEDYQVLLSVNPGNWKKLKAEALVRGIVINKIGVLTEGSAVIWRDSSGRPVDIAVPGWDHF